MKDSVQLVLDQIITTFGPAGKDAQFKTYYNGDPEVIPKFNLPAIIVTQTKDTTTEAMQGEDDISDEIRIKILFDKSDDFAGTLSDPLNTTDKKLRDLVGRRASDGTYAEGTIKRMLREDLLEGVTAIAPTMNVEYGINPRETLGSEGNAFLTAEAWVTFTIEYSSFTY